MVIIRRPRWRRKLWTKLPLIATRSSVPRRHAFTDQWGVTCQLRSLIKSMSFQRASKISIYLWYLQLDLCIWDLILGSELDFYNIYNIHIPKYWPTWILYGSCKPQLTNNTLIVLIMSPHVLCFWDVSYAWCGHREHFVLAECSHECLLSEAANVHLQWRQSWKKSRMLKNVGISYVSSVMCVLWWYDSKQSHMCISFDSTNHQVPRILHRETGSLTWSMLRWWHQKPERLWWAVQHVHLVWWELAPEWFGDEKCQHRRALPLWHVVIDVPKGFSLQISQRIHWLNDIECLWFQTWCIYIYLYLSIYLEK